MRNFKVSYNTKCTDPRSKDYGFIKFDNIRSFKTFYEANDFTKLLINNHYTSLQLVGKPVIVLPEEN